LSDVEF